MDLLAVGAGTPSPVSTEQQQIWFAEQLGAHPAGYLVPSLLKIDGPLDVPALARSLAAIVSRHEVLRTSLDGASPQVADGGPRGRLWPVEAFRLETETVSAAGLVSLGGLEGLVRAEVSRPLEVTARPPIRARLLSLPGETHVLCVVVHHVAFDDWSRRVLYRELTELYRGFRAGRDVRLPPLPAQFAEFAAARAAQNDGHLARQREYWREQLAGLVPFELLPELPRPPRRAGRGSAATVTVPRVTAERLSRLAARRGATPAMVLFAACQIVLRHYSGRDDVTVGTTVALRDQPESEPLIGPLINVLVLRGDTSGDPTFNELVDRMRELALDAFDSPDVPFRELVEDSAPERELSRTPLFQVMVGYGSGRRTLPDLSGTTVSELPMPWFASKYDLSIWFDAQPDGSLLGTVAWDSDLYLAGSMQRLAAHLDRVLLEVAKRPDTRIGDLQLSAAEQAVAAGFTAGPLVERHPACLHETIRRQATRTPDAPALVSPDGTITSYAELNAAANRIAHGLRRAGVGPGTLVALCSERSPELVAGLLGVLKAGGAYVPIDPEYPAERIAFMIEDTAASVQLVQGHLRDVLPGGLVLDDPATWAGCPDTDPSPSADPEDPAIVIFTSGSTGRPKGVLLGHAGLAERMQRMQEIHPLGLGDAMLQKAPISFDGSLSELFWPLGVGARVVLARRGGQKDTRYLRDLIIDRQVTAMQFVPSLLTLFLAEDGVAECTSLRVVIPGGEELPSATARTFLRLFPACALYNAYGPTETSIYVNWWRCRPGSLTGLNSLPLGSPFANVRLYVLDDALRTAAPGAVGELYVGGTGQAIGYHDRAALTAERFLPDPYGAEPGSRLYRTGDLVRLRPDGHSLDFIGRIDGQVKVRGFRIELGEVEAVLGRHPAVGEVIATVWDAGPEDRRLVAYLTAADGPVPAAELRAFAARQLPAHAVPSLIVVLPELPRLPNSKIDRLRLPIPVASEPAAGEHVAPGTPVEQDLADIWAEVLGTARIGATDNFFALGGHSMLVIRVMNRVREWVDLDLPLAMLFDHPTVAEMAAEIERVLGAAAVADA